MAKKSSGNLYIDEFKDLIGLMSKLRYIAKVAYIGDDGLVYLQSIRDYQKNMVQLDPSLKLDAYAGIIIDLAKDFDKLNHIRKTSCNIYKDENNYIVFENQHKDHMGEITKCITASTKDIDIDEGIVDRLLCSMYAYKDNRLYTDVWNDIFSIQNAEWSIILGEGNIEEFLTIKARYIDLDVDGVLYTGIISNDAFPLISKKTLLLDHRIAEVDDKSVLVAFRQIENDYMIHTFMKFMKVRKS